MKMLKLNSICLFSHCTALFFAFAVTALAQEYTNRQEIVQDKELWQDFVIQGEYLNSDGCETCLDVGNMGMHLIADGDGKFRVVGLAGGLPGDGWKAGYVRVLGTAQINGGELLFTMTEAVGMVRGKEVKMSQEFERKGTFTIVSSQRPEGEVCEKCGGSGQCRQPFHSPDVVIAVPFQEMYFMRRDRVSPTFDMQPPEGAIVLFDGTNVDNFPGASMNELKMSDSAEESQEQPATMNTLWAGATSKPLENRPYTMHLEFMLSYMPQASEQARSNSGVYIDERYELQVLDSFGLKEQDNECGGFYQVAAPLLNMCFPPLAWQTYDIDFTPASWDGDKKVENARITVKHNGVLIHDNIELKSNTPGGKPESPEPLGVHLQGHGNKVQYRNLWVQYKNLP